MERWKKGGETGLKEKVGMHGMFRVVGEAGEALIRSLVRGCTQ